MFKAWTGFLSFITSLIILKYRLILKNNIFKSMRKRGYIMENDENNLEYTTDGDVIQNTASEYIYFR